MDKVQVSGAGNTTFAVCLDQDEKKILQRVTRSAHTHTHNENCPKHYVLMLTYTVAHHNYFILVTVMR